MGLFTLEGSFWRRMARLGARGPRWFSRLAPPVVGVLVCAAAPAPRAAIARNLRRVRGRRGSLREGLDVARVFATYASCLTEVLEEDAGHARAVETTVHGAEHFENARGDGRGVVLVTAHTAGWESVGHAFRLRRGLPILIATSAETDLAARQIQEHARSAQGLLLTHVGGDSLSGLALMGHLKKAGVVALQIDRAPAPMRAREVTLFGEPFRLPEGPLRLAALCQAPVVPVFTARLGYRQYRVEASAPIRVSRHPRDAELDAVARSIALALENFVREHPTQWFHFKAG
jgi:lauroyl/myristoyl acyltransferase